MTTIGGLGEHVQLFLYLALFHDDHVGAIYSATLYLLFAERLLEIFIQIGACQLPAVYPGRSGPAFFRTGTNSVCIFAVAGDADLSLFQAQKQQE